MASIYEHELAELRAKLERLDTRAAQGHSVTDHVPVSTSTLWGLLDDHDELVALKELTAGTKVIDPSELQRGVGTVTKIEEGTSVYPVKATVAFKSMVVSGIPVEHLRKL